MILIAHNDVLEEFLKRGSQSKLHGSRLTQQHGDPESVYLLREQDGWGGGQSDFRCKGMSKNREGGWGKKGPLSGRELFKEQIKCNNR